MWKLCERTDWIQWNARCVVVLTISIFGWQFHFTMTFYTTNPNWVRHNSILIKMLKKERNKWLFTHLIRWCVHNVWHYLTFLYSLSCTSIAADVYFHTIMLEPEYRLTEYIIPDLPNMACVANVLVSAVKRCDYGSLSLSFWL